MSTKHEQNPCIIIIIIFMFIYSEETINN